ncbi:MAG: ACT domain-containing protein, partial [Candidatus Delongbacteria bacterium]
IHENIGNTCIAAKKGGKVIPLSSQLENGDIIEIITSPRSAPTYNWLRFAKSPRARTAIRHFLKREENQKTVKLGREIFTSEILKYNLKIEKKTLQHVLRSFGFHTPEDFYSAVGNGDIRPNQFMRKISGLKRDGLLTRLVSMIRVKSPAALKDDGRQHADSIIYASCCHPLPGDSIVGQRTAEGKLIIHISNCPTIGSIDPSELVNTVWDVNRDEDFEVSFKVAGEDRPNLLFEMIKVINSLNINLSYIEIKSENSIATGSFTGRVKNLSHFIRLRKKLFAVKGVLSIERLIQ